MPCSRAFSRASRSPASRPFALRRALPPLKVLPPSVLPPSVLRLACRVSSGGARPPQVGQRRRFGSDVRGLWGMAGRLVAAWARAVPLSGCALPRAGPMLRAQRDERPAFGQQDASKAFRIVADRPTRRCGRPFWPVVGTPRGAIRTTAATGIATSPKATASAGSATRPATSSAAKPWQDISVRPTPTFG